jgi:hypothetical protein
LLSAAGTAWWQRRGDPIDPWPHDARYLPDQCHVVATIKLEELLISSAGKSILKQIARAGRGTSITFAPTGRKAAPVPDQLADAREQLAQEIRNETGLDLSNIVRVTIGHGEGDWRSVFIFRTRNPVKPQEVLERLSRNVFRLVGTGKPIKDPDPIQVGAHTIHVKAGGNAFVIPEDRIVVHGAAQTLRAILERNAEPKLSADLTEALTDVDGSKTIGLAIVLTKANNEKTIPGAPEWLGGATPPLAGAVNFEFSEQIKATFKATFKDQRNAAKVMSTVQASIVSAKNVPGEMGKLIQSVEVSQSGTHLTITASAGPDVVAGIANPAQMARVLGYVGNGLQGRAADSTFRYVAGSVKSSGGLTTSKPKAGDGGIKLVPSKVEPRSR